MSAHPANDEGAGRLPEARYAYYRRCQVFRRNGEQCKGPAEKDSLICHAHAGQLAMAVRRERERRAVLAEAVAEMRRRGRPEFEMADLFMDFNGIQVTIAAMARALIGGRIDCKTAGRLAVVLQTASKLLWMVKQAEKRLSAEARRRAENEGQQEAVAALIPPVKAVVAYASQRRHAGLKYSPGPSELPGLHGGSTPTSLRSDAARDLLQRMPVAGGTGPPFFIAELQAA